MDIDKLITILQIVSLICISIIFAVRMQNNVEKYILPRPKEECWEIFIIVMLVVGILYFSFQYMCKKMIWPFYEKFYNL